MTEKQEKILDKALELFAEQGFASTSTSKVAKAAGVSEGLIFRHFTNKEGLLDAILKMGEERAKELFSDIVLEPDPKELLKKYIELPQKVRNDKAALEFWKLQFKIKWELEIYGEHKMAELEESLIRAFDLLRYNEPEQEANLLLTLMDGLATRGILQETYDMDSATTFLKHKYKI
ncbi:TetR/AcrR family transcriptional regulator [Ekhidna sp.]|uniref:TetR/AcrR family transcriptional regulator n=1 Tax=Ekhidna sp. TaxID=2608089 RepID=UPI003B512731